MYVPGYPTCIESCDPSGIITLEEAVKHIYRTLDLVMQIKNDLDRGFSIGTIKISFLISELSEFKERYEEQIRTGKL